jgi:hypothetical protein
VGAGGADAIASPGELLGRPGTMQNLPVNSPDRERGRLSISQVSKPATVGFAAVEWQVVHDRDPADLASPG